MITSLHLENFRCFRDFTLNEIRPITLIGGENNIGKTTLLESLFLIFANNDPNLFFKINKIRDIQISNNDTEMTWEHLFYEKDMNNTILIHVDDNYNKILFSINKSTDIITSNLSIIHQNNEFRISPNTYPINIKLEYNNEVFNANWFFTPGGLAFKWNESPRINIFRNAKYIGVMSDDDHQIAMQFGKIVKSGKKNIIINILKHIEHDIEDISTIAETIPRLYIQKTNKPLLPLAVMGNGINRLMGIACSILEYEGGTVLIDEIETGFHHKFYHNLWKTIEKIAAQMNVQIFATTHSYECTEAALNSIQNKENFCYVRLNKKENNIIPYLFPNDTLAYSFENSLEVR